MFNVQASITGETTRFANYGPNRGHTFHFNFTKYISLGSTFQDAYVIEGDLRKYLRLNNKTLLAFRLFGTNSGGKNPLIYWIGGNNTIRSVGFRRWSGTNTFFFNAEFRFPLIDLAATPIGLLGPVRGVLFFDVGAAWFDEQEFRILEKGKFKLKDAIASYGFGIEFFMFGLPIHLDWVYTTNFDEKKYLGIEFWIGLDF